MQLPISSILPQTSKQIPPTASQLPSISSCILLLLLQQYRTFEIGAYLWERVGRTAGRAIGGQDADGRTGSHLEGLMTFVVGVVLEVVEEISLGRRDLEIRSWEILVCGPSSLKRPTQKAWASMSRVFRRGASLLCFPSNTNDILPFG